MTGVLSAMGVNPAAALGASMAFWADPVALKDAVKGLFRKKSDDEANTD